MRREWVCEISSVASYHDCGDDGAEWPTPEEEQDTSGKRNFFLRFSFLFFYNLYASKALAHSKQDSVIQNGNNAMLSGYTEHIKCTQTKFWART